MNRTIIALRGKAGQVFELFNLICEEYGHLTLEELAKGAKHGYLILWEAK